MKVNDLGRKKLIRHLLLTPLLSRNPVSPPQQPLLAQMNAPTVYGPAYLRVSSEAVTMLPCYALELRC